MRTRKKSSDLILLMLLGTAFFFGASAAIEAQSSTPWRTAQGRACINAWMQMAVSRLNATNLGQSYNSRKPWRFNRYGLLLGRGSYSNSWLGFPISDEFSVRGGKQSNFEGGYIYWQAGTRRTTAHRYR